MFPFALAERWRVDERLKGKEREQGRSGKGAANIGGEARRLEERRSGAEVESVERSAAERMEGGIALFDWRFVKL